MRLSKILPVLVTLGSIPLGSAVCAKVILQRQARQGQQQIANLSVITASNFPFTSPVFLPREFDNARECVNAPGECAISKESIQRNLTFLASDLNRGRMAGEGPLENEVTSYIESIFNKLGLKAILKDGYRQPFIIDWEDKKAEENQNVDKKPVKPNPTGEPKPKSLFRRDKNARLFSEVPDEGVSLDAIYTHNLVALIEGTDKELKDEYIVICAHYDHVGEDKLARPGKDRIFNGADDNASGTCAVIEVAGAIKQALRENKGPKRSVIVLLATAEEMGLLGSKFFVENPPVPLENIRAMINLDMVGRNHPSTISVLDSDNEKKPNFFHNDHDKLVQGTGIEKIFHDIEFGRYRSDQWNFLDHGIPSLLIFEGLVKPEPNDGKIELNEDYHEIGDEISKVNFEKIRRVATLVHRQLMNAANRADISRKK